MKKMRLFLAVVCMILIASCSNNQQPKDNAQGGTCDKEHQDSVKWHNRGHGGGFELTAEQKAAFEKWQKFDSLPVEEQKALISSRKAAIDEREAKMKEIEEKWANFDNLSIAEQKTLIDEKEMSMFRGGWLHGQKCMCGQNCMCNQKGSCGNEKCSKQCSKAQDCKNRDSKEMHGRRGGFERNHPHNIRK